MKLSKTNAMRLLDTKKIVYTVHFYDTSDGTLDGISVAHKTGQDPSTVFKTLVTHCEQNFFVFCIPVAKELDLKLAAKAAGQKYIEMIPVSTLTKTTGYIKGGCSPFAMKKQFPTFLDESALCHSTILVSGGKIGTQIKIAPQDILNVLGAQSVLLTI